MHRRQQPQWYGVASPEYDMHSATQYDPAEYGRDWLPVFTSSARRARVLAVRAWRRRHRTKRGRTLYINQEPDLNPFVGLEVEPLTPCPHGREWCAECLSCIADMEAECYAAGMGPADEEG